MKILDKILLKNYSENRSDDYFIARNLSVILILSWFPLAFLSLLAVLKPNVTFQVVYIFIIINIALVLVRIKKIVIAAPLLLLSVSIVSTILVFSPAALFGVYEVYKLAFYQLVLIIITVLITYNPIYVYFLTVYSSLLIVLHFFLRGLKIDRSLVLANFEDYFIALFLVILYGFILGREISIKRKTIKSLKLSEEKYATVINNSSEGIIIHKEGIIKFVNRAAAGLAGTVESNLINRPISDFVETSQRKHVTDRMYKRMAGEEISELFNVRIEKTDGSVLEVESKRTDIIFQGEKSVLLFLRDITERKKLQETLIQSEKMLSLGGLAAGMAHEINNPLAGILQNAQIISNRLTKDTLENRKIAEEIGLDFSALQIFLTERKIISQLSRIREAGSRAAEIVYNMLNFARRESSRSSNKITELLDKTIDMASNDYDLKEKYDFKSIKIVRVYEENLPFVACDASQIQQVFFNILKNGAEAMYASPKVDSAEFILVVRQQGKMIRTEIKNNLTGIPEAKLSRIFNPFYSTKAAGKGTGLGLSISYFIIHEAHKGELKVESDGETWVSFIIELPVA